MRWHLVAGDGVAFCLDGLGEPTGQGTEDEKIRPLDVSERPGTPSRALFTEDQIAADLVRLEQGQQDDGGWDVDYLHWSPGQSVEWRGIATLRALESLHAHGRLELPYGADSTRAG